MLLDEEDDDELDDFELAELLDFSDSLLELLLGWSSEPLSVYLLPELTVTVSVEPFLTLVPLGRSCEMIFPYSTESLSA